MNQRLVLFWMPLLQRNASWSQCDESKLSGKFSFIYAQYITVALSQPSMDWVNFRSCTVCICQGLFGIENGSEPCQEQSNCAQTKKKDLNSLVVIRAQPLWRLPWSRIQKERRMRKKWWWKWSRDHLLLVSRTGWQPGSSLNINRLITSGHRSSQTGFFYRNFIGFKERLWT